MTATRMPVQRHRYWCRCNQAATHVTVAKTPSVDGRSCWTTWVVRTCRDCIPTDTDRQVVISSRELAA